MLQEKSNRKLTCSADLCCGYTATFVIEKLWILSKIYKCGFLKHNEAALLLPTTVTL